MTFGEGSQAYLGEPTFNFLYRVLSDGRTRSITSRAEDSEAAKVLTEKKLNDWHGRGQWEWA
jgi:hypothetical protein